MSLPSGHAAGTFATATVLRRHFGWKVGIPAYAAGAYVASSRMSANKHHLSDVIMGAAFGIAAAHTVTIGSGGTRFEMGVNPTAGGGVVTFTKK
jgi:membrane-associated phospholipid phosphatase